MPLLLLWLQTTPVPITLNKPIVVVSFLQLSVYLVVSKSWGLSCRNMLVIEKAEVGEKLVVEDDGEVCENDINEGQPNFENIFNNESVTGKESSVGSQDSLDSGYWALLK